MLGDTIQSLRRQRGLTQEELAIRLHVVRQTVSKWEKGRSVPDAEMLQHLARELDVSVSTLLGEPAGPETEADRGADLTARQLARISEQLAVKNRRDRRIWTAVGVIGGLLILVPLLLLLLGAPLLAIRPGTGATVSRTISAAAEDPVFPTDEVRRAMDALEQRFKTDRALQGWVLESISYEEETSLRSSAALAEKVGRDRVLALTVSFTTGKRNVPEGLAPETAYRNRTVRMLRNDRGDWEPAEGP